MEEGNLLKKMKVLYVEDEAITRKQVYRFLKKRLGKVITAENGQDGIEKFIEHNPDIIITDLVMPDISGIEMMKKLRKDGHKCPFIITSALSDTNTILETVDLKIEKYLIKPIDTKILIENLIQISTEILEDSKDSLVINSDNILTPEIKNEMELEIRNLYSKYLKKATGRGAKNIEVLIKGKTIEIFSKENLTTLESTLLSTGEYQKTVEVIRKTIYENTIHEVEYQIEELLSRKVVMKDIHISPIEKYERLILDII
ncbi:Na-translocating system protein MpsC family protein [Dethiothermospora halolimnae]|uniref:Na-translocating system protein MpsC family protein n=1 Tax=Dethiothermospora halolimnae TaxID=3114390 RepID=UPI003CCC32EE